MRTLLFSQCHIRHDVEGRLMKTALTLNERLNPGLDYLLMENASPMSILPYLPDSWNGAHLVRVTSDSWLKPPKIDEARTVAVFPDALGHFNLNKRDNPNPKDGPGRATSTALAMAIASGYDRALYLEMDALVFWSACRGFDHMAGLARWEGNDGPPAIGWSLKTWEPKVGFQPRLPSGYLDMQAWFFADLQWLRHVRAIERYDWPARRGDFTGEPTGELIWEQIFRDDLSVLPMRGGRGGMCDFDGSNVRERFPDGIDYITHVGRSGYAAALEMNGHGDLAPYLMG